MTQAMPPIEGGGLDELSPLNRKDSGGLYFLVLARVRL